MTPANGSAEGGAEPGPDQRGSDTLHVRLVAIWLGRLARVRIAGRVVGLRVLRHRGGDRDQGRETNTRKGRRERAHRELSSAGSGPPNREPSLRLHLGRNSKRQGAPET